VCVLRYEESVEMRGSGERVKRLRGDEGEGPVGRSNSGLIGGGGREKEDVARAWEEK